jgi:hypothetical protein
LIFEIINQQRDDEKEATPKFKYLLAKEEKGPISALGVIQGLLVAAIGSKVRGLYIDASTCNPIRTYHSVYFRF